MLGTSTAEVVGGIVAVGVLVVAASAIIKRLAAFVLGLIDRFR